MKPTKISELRDGDVIRFSEQSKDPFTVRGSSVFSESKNLWVLTVRGPGALNEIISRPDMEVFAVEMYRTVEVPCRAARHQGGPLTLMHNFAAGPAPFAVICGECDDEITAEVVAAVKEPQPRRGDKVLVGDEELRLSAFHGETDTLLSSGQVISSTDIEPVTHRVWRYNPNK